MESFSLRTTEEQILYLKTLCDHYPIDSIEDAESRNTRDFEFTLEQSTAQNEEINIQHARSNFGLLFQIL